MRNRTMGTAALLCAVNAAFVVACVGGGGGLSDEITTWDRAPSSREGAANSREGAPGFREVAPQTRESAGASAEPGPGAQGVGGPGAGNGGGGGFDCAGTYSCQEVGKSDTDTITVVNVGGVCSVVDKDGSAVLESSGQLTLNGRVLGTWSPSATGFTVTVDNETSICTKGGVSRAGNGTGSGNGSGGGSGSGSSSGSTGSTPTVPLDAGVRPRDAG